MLGKGFLSINGTAIPNPVDFDIDFEAIENVLTSEAGTDLVNVVRLNKRTFSGTWNLSSNWLGQFQSFANSRLVTLTYLGVDYSCRARGFSAKLVENSARTHGTDGLWEVSLDFIQI